MASTDQSRFLDRYLSTHSGCKNYATESYALLRDIVERLPPPSRQGMAVLDVGCGQGNLVRLLRSRGYAAYGVDLSSEQVAAAKLNGVEAVVCGDYREFLRSRQYSAVVATDLVEHFTKPEVVEFFDIVHRALMPGGLLVIRCPNAASPFGGAYQYGDFTHSTALTERSFAQLAAVAGFDRVEVFPCPPVVHGVKSLVRAAVWVVASALMKGVTLAETGRAERILTQNFVGMAAK